MRGLHKDVPRNGLTEINTCAIYVYSTISDIPPPPGSPTHVNLPVLKPLFQVVIDTLIADRREQRHIRHAHLLLLESFFPIRLARTSDGNHRQRSNAKRTHLDDLALCSAVRDGQRGRRSGLFPGLFGDCLCEDGQDSSLGMKDGELAMLRGVCQCSRVSVGGIGDRAGLDEGVLSTSSSSAQGDRMPIRVERGAPRSGRARSCGGSRIW